MRDFGARKPGVVETKVGGLSSSIDVNRSTKSRHNLRPNPKKSEKSVSFQKSDTREGEESGSRANNDGADWVQWDGNLGGDVGRPLPVG